MQRNRILKYLNGSASPIEENEVEDWIGASQKNTRKFNLLKAQYIASTFDETVESTSVDSAFRRYKTNIDLSFKNKKRRTWSTSLKYAATIVLLFGLGYLADKAAFSTTPTLVIPEDAITLQLENGSIQVIKEDGAAQVTDSKGTVLGAQQGNRLIYNNKTTSKKLTYNTLTVPYGKRFDIVLSDSTHVILNAGTSIKYPVKFIKGKKREIYLTGEAFFEVAKDAGHPFIVNASGLNVRVLGTKFNVSAYPEDGTTKTMLVEGSVGLYQDIAYNPETTTFLKPGHVASFNKTNKDISVEKAESSLYTGWMDGNLIFRHVPFKNIIKKLERHYNVVITNHNKTLGTELFTASFDNSTLEQVFQTFQNNYGLEYSINKDEIIINP